MKPLHQNFAIVQFGDHGKLWEKIHIHQPQFFFKKSVVYFLPELSECNGYPDWSLFYFFFFLMYLMF